MKPREKFQLIWQGLRGPRLDQEHRFHPKRKWRHDFFLADSAVGPVAIEIEGGIWLGKSARHTNPAGYWKDCEKYNESAFMGNKVIRLAGPLINEPYIGRLVLWVGGGTKPAPKGGCLGVHPKNPPKNRDRRTSR
jgi:hypothetical protein